MRATEELLDQLHGLLAEAMLEQLKTYTTNDEEIPSAFLGQVIKFLKENGIDTPGGDSSRVDAILDELNEAEIDMSNVTKMR